MSYEIGISNIRQMIKGFYNKPGLRFHAYNFKAGSDSHHLKLLIWRGSELFDPVSISFDQLRDCEKTDLGYLQLERYLENEVKERLRQL